MNSGELSKLSELLTKDFDDTTKRSIIRLYGDYVRTLRTFPTSTRRPHENEIINDYNRVKASYKMAPLEPTDANQTNEANDTNATNEDIERIEQQMNKTLAESSRANHAGNNRTPFNESLIQALQPYLTAPSNKVNLNELVIKPDPFNGYSPKPRDWIEAYEEAFMANEWSTLLFDTSAPLPDYIRPSNIQDPNSTRFAETDALRKIRKLAESLQEARIDLNALNTPVGGVSYATWNKVLMLSIFIMVNVFIYVWRHNHKTFRRHHGRVMKTLTEQLQQSNGLYPSLQVVLSYSS